MRKFVNYSSSAVFLIVQLVFLSQSNVSANEFYVVADDGFNCPVNRSCETIDYYINDQTRYFVSDTIFYFLEGTHFIQPERTLLITSVKNITFLGLGRQTLGFHETVTQSTAILQCESPTSNIVFMLSTSINISSLTITNCGRMLPDESMGYRQYLINQSSIASLLYYSNITLAVLEVIELNIYQLSIQNGSGYGFAAINAHHLTITHSSFSQNGNEACYNTSCLGGNIGIFYTNTIRCYAGITYCYMSNVNFSFGLNTNRIFGSGGLLILLDQTEMYGVGILLNNISAFGNTGVAGLQGANMALLAFTEAKYALVINNMVNSYGNRYSSLKSDLIGPVGGLYIINGLYTFTKLRDCGIQLKVEKPITVNNSIFHSNFGTYTGGLDIDIVSADTEINQFVQIENTHFLKNSGNFTLHMSFFRHTIGMTAPVSIHFKNVTASYGVSNEEYQAFSAITFFQAFIATFSGIKVEHNEGVGLWAIQSSITFYDKNNMFRNNSGVRGGGMYLVDNSYIILKLPTIIYFIDNHATKTGGAINVEGAKKTLVCFFQVIILDPFNYNITNDNSGLYFQNNTAEEAGSLLYGGGIDQCSLLASTLVGSVFRNSTEVFDTFFLYETYLKDISRISSDANKICFCDIQNRPNCDVSRKTITIYPGQEISIPLITVGQRNGAAMGTLKAVEIAQEHQINEVLKSWQPACSNYNHTIIIDTSIGDYNSTTIYLSTDETPSNIIIEIDMLDCPPGFMLSDSGNCICSHELTNTFADTLCDLDNQLILTQGGVWMGYNVNQTCITAYSSCPFDYCTLSEVTFDITEPDKQCAFNRSGLLCGECAKGLSLLLGSNQCGECTNDYISLLIPFSLAGIALVAFLILLNLTVSIGTINGLIFFANIVKLNEAVYFPNGPVIIISQFISWLNFDLGIQTCFYKGMDSYVKVWLQFAFPFYIWLIIVVMIILAKYTKFYKVIGNNAVPVLATLVLLSYIKLIRTVTLALHPIPIECGGSFSNTVWLVDPNVNYFSLKHIILFVFAIIVLIVLILPFTFVLLFLQIIERHVNKLRCCHFWIKLKPFFDAYGGPYKDKYRFWTGLVLLTRLLILSVITLNAHKTTVLSAIISSVTFLFSVSITLGGVYKKWYANFAESIFFLLLVIMSTFAAGNYTYTATIVSVSIAFVAFILILLFHLAIQLQKRECVNRIEDRVRNKLVGRRCTQELNMEALSSDEREPSDNYYSFELVRNELLLDDDDDDGYILQSTNK